jgi:S-adenosylmethionine decarboxylase
MIKNRPFIEHKIIEIFKLDSTILNKAEFVLPYIERFAGEANLKIIKKEFHNFSPFGATMIFVLSSSHLAVHTWPENNYLHIDLLTCAHAPENNVLMEILKEVFSIKSDQILIREVKYE